MTGISDASRRVTTDNAIVINKPKEGEFYVLSYDSAGGGRGHGVELENEDSLVTPPNKLPLPEGAGFPPFNEMPRLRYDKSAGDMPKDLQSGVVAGYWLVSEPLKRVLEAVDPEGFAFVPCKFFLEDGSEGPPHYLCDVIRTLDAIDELASKVKIKAGDNFRNGKYYKLGGGARFAFKKDVIGSAHVFLTPYTAAPFCDRVMRDALIENGFGKPPVTRGVSLEDAASIGIYGLPSKYWPKDQ